MSDVSYQLSPMYQVDKMPYPILRSQANWDYVMSLKKTDTKAQHKIEGTSKSSHEKGMACNNHWPASAISKKHS